MNDPRLEALEESAARRRGDGTYPPDIDDDLRSEIDRRMRAASTHTTALRAAVAQVRALGPFELPRYSGSNRAKAIYDRAVQKLVGHALADLVRQLEAYRTAVDRVLEAVLDDERTGDDDP